MTISKPVFSGHHASEGVVTAVGAGATAGEERLAGGGLVPADAVPTVAPNSVAKGPSPGNVRSARSEEILDGAAQMFAEHGYNGASLRNIADHVGLSHPGMLHHFPTKDTLLDAVIDRLEAHAQGALNRIDELSSDPDTLLRGLAQIWHPGSHTMQLMATLDAEVVSKEHPGRFRIARLHRVHEHMLEQCFATFGERGLLREDIDPAFASRAVLALALSHAAREEIVRSMQQACHDDSPIKDLTRLVRSFLALPDA